MRLIWTRKDCELIDPFDLECAPFDSEFYSFGQAQGQPLHIRFIATLCVLSFIDAHLTWMDRIDKITATAFVGFT